MNILLFLLFKNVLKMTPLSFEIPVTINFKYIKNVQYFIKKQRRIGKSLPFFFFFSNF